ncbi:MAG: hypothetical protein Q8N22_00455 [bacterium]|nr:hypothetical protein [bacterium]
MKSRYHHLKPRIIALRKSGKTYTEICKIIGINISKGTLSDWCGSISLSPEQQQRVERSIKRGTKKGQAVALVVNKLKREKYIQAIRDRVNHLPDKLKDENTSKIALAMLYLGEGSKTKRGSLMFGNSDPLVIRLFLGLLRYCYDINENKFRCTLQCRADQDIKKLEKFWSNITKIPFSQFYKARIDPRTIGKRSKKKDYKGVCRIDYFSADIFNELQIIIEIIGNIEF